MNLLLCDKCPGNARIWPQEAYNAHMATHADKLEPRECQHEVCRGSKCRIKNRLAKRRGKRRLPNQHSMGPVQFRDWVRTVRAK